MDARKQAIGTDGAAAARKAAIIDALARFIRQRPGLEFGNYGDFKSYNAECRSIARDRREALTLLAAVKWRDGIDADALIKAATGAYSGRLTITERDWKQHTPEACPGRPCGDCCDHREPQGFRIDYVTGQYFPTEYRRAACAVLASALWDYTREHAMPPPKGYRAESWSQPGKGRSYGTMFATRAEADADLAELGGELWGRVAEVYSLSGESAGDWLRAHFRKEFGRGIAARWFS